MPSDTESDSEQSAQESIEDDENRLSDDEEFPMSEEDEVEVGAAKGWAGSMAKVLKSEKTGVLSKAKKVEDVAKKKEKKPYTFEIEGEVKNEDDQKPDEKALERALEKRRRRERREVNYNLMWSYQ